MVKNKDKLSIETKLLSNKERVRQTKIRQENKYKAKQNNRKKVCNITKRQYFVSFINFREKEREREREREKERKRE